MKKKFSNANCKVAGFSLIELLIVLTLIFILSAISLFYLSGHQTLYKPDDQTLLIADILHEARQRSLTQRETMRVEINRSTNQITLIDENTNQDPTDTADNDRVLKSLNLFDPSVVTIGISPGQITYNPPEPLPVPTTEFIPSIYPPSGSQSVCTLRFLANGTVVNAGNDPIGTGAVANGATLHIWSPSAVDSANSDIARAITVIGSSGSVRIWEFDQGSPAANKWKDSRRSGSY
ncbi:MAG: prepilin-type N-terminal cleavage/methylation domain-containing protein [Blastocatellia bacterium]|nr:prepilin-type N-terminal cleavage/methylation domain-containing protein [Blastocatellia bacterium]